MKAKPIITGLAALGLIILTLPSCDKESADGKGLDLMVQANNKAFTIPVAGGNSIINTTTTSSVKWDEARMIVSSIRLEAQPNSEGGELVNLYWQGPKMIDLFNFSEITGTIGLPPGAYNNVSFELRALASDAGKDPVMYLSGIYSGTSGKATPIIVEISDDLTISSHRDALTIAREKKASGTIIILLDRLFSEILPGDLDQALTTDGTILITRDSNPELYRIIMENLRNLGGSNNEVSDDTTDFTKD